MKERPPKMIRVGEGLYERVAQEDEEAKWDKELLDHLGLVDQHLSKAADRIRESGSLSADQDRPEIKKMLDDLRGVSHRLTRLKGEIQKRLK